MNSACVLAAQDLSVGYGSKVILSGLTFRVEAGSMVALLGRNGGGKSTLLRTLAGLQKPLAGTYEMAPTALVLTNYEVMSHTTVHDIVAMGRYPYTAFLGGLSDTDEQVIRESLKQVLPAKTGEETDSAVEEMLRREFASLSDGEKQRVLIAKALAQQTQVILLDEPTSYLDIPSRIQIFRLLQTLAHEQGKAILISTHELDLAQRYADRLMPVDDILDAIKDTL